MAAIAFWWGDDTPLPPREDGDENAYEERPRPDLDEEEPCEDS